MSERPLVSIIIPAFNAGNYIGNTLKSVQNQTWDNIEIIVVNDGSTDNTAIVIHEFLEDKRIKYIFQANQGASVAKNTGLENATGNLIQYLDADDILSADKIEQQVKLIKGKSFDIAVCRTKIFHEFPGDDDKEIDSEFLYNSDDSLEYVLNLYGLNGKIGMIQPNAFLLSKELSEKIGAWNDSISYAPNEDGEYFCRVMLASKVIHFSNGVNFYRKPLLSGNNLSTKKNFVNAKGALRVLSLISEHLLSLENSDRVKKTMAVHFASFIYAYSSLYKDLCEEAETYIYKMGLKKIPKAGGDKFQKIVSLIGFKKALALKNIFS